MAIDNSTVLRTIDGHFRIEVECNGNGIMMRAIVDGHEYEVIVDRTMVGTHEAEHEWTTTAGYEHEQSGVTKVRV